MWKDHSESFTKIPLHKNYFVIVFGTYKNQSIPVLIPPYPLHCHQSQSPDHTPSFSYLHSHQQWKIFTSVLMDQTNYSILYLSFPLDDISLIVLSSVMFSVLNSFSLILVSLLTVLFLSWAFVLLFSSHSLWWLQNWLLHLMPLRGHVCNPTTMLLVSSWRGIIIQTREQKACWSEWRTCSLISSFRAAMCVMTMPKLEGKVANK